MVLFLVNRLSYNFGHIYTRWQKRCKIFFWVSHIYSYIISCNESLIFHNHHDFKEFNVFNDYFKMKPILELSSPDSLSEHPTIKQGLFVFSVIIWPFLLILDWRSTFKISPTSRLMNLMKVHIWELKLVLQDVRLDYWTWWRFTSESWSWFCKMFVWWILNINDWDKIFYK